MDDSLHRCVLHVIPKITDDRVVAFGSTSRVESEAAPMSEEGFRPSFQMEPATSQSTRSNFPSTCEMDEPEVP